MNLSIHFLHSSTYLHFVLPMVAPKSDLPLWYHVTKDRVEIRKTRGDITPAHHFPNPKSLEDKIRSKRGIQALGFSFVKRIRSCDFFQDMSIGW